MVPLAAAVIVVAAQASSPGKVSRGTMPVKRSNLFHGNVLPQYRWMCKMSGAEFAESGYCTVAGRGYNKQGPINAPCSVQVDPECPDWAFDGLWADIRTMTLPYTVQDVYDRAQEDADVPVLLLENDELKATITPQWGGRLWSLTNKRTGKELFYNNRHFQPTNDALRQAYQQGGSEWNFGPQIGHMSDTLTDVFAASLATERGNVLRVWAMERTTAAVWQVDMLLGNRTTLWLHVTLTNPRPEPIVGYWWTNVGVQVDVDGSNQTRILTPATHWLSDAARAALPPWPFFYERSGASMMMSAFSNASSHGDWTYPTFPELGVRPTDHSFAYNWWEKRDVWFDLVSSERRVRYNGWVDKDGGFMLHGHPNNGTKAWMWGAAPDEVFWQSFGGGPENLENVPPGQHNMYTELQTGVMPTQYQGFPLQPNGGVRSWTEFFTTEGDPIQPAVLGELLSDDYHGTAIAAADRLLAAKQLGGRIGKDLGGTQQQSTAVYDEMDAWFRQNVISRTPSAAELMHEAEGWGALEELRRGGKPLSNGALFPPIDTLGQQQGLSQGREAAVEAETETLPWLELLVNGTFSSDSLSRHAISFQAGGYRDLIGTSWLEVLNQSAVAHGATWLHHFHIGVILLERTLVPGDGNFTAAKAAFESALALRSSSPEVLRNLAIIAHAEKDHALAFDYYYAALQSLVAAGKINAIAGGGDDGPAELLLRDIASEAAYQFALLGWSNATLNLTQPAGVGGSSVVPENSSARATDRFRFGAVQAAMGRKAWAEVFALLDCAPERLWPTLGWWGGGTLMLGQWFLEAKMQAAVEANRGVALSQLQSNALWRASPVPFCIRAAGH